MKNKVFTPYHKSGSGFATYRKIRTGFTLIEFLISILIFSIFIYAFTISYFRVTDYWNKVYRGAIFFQKATNILNHLRRDIKNSKSIEVTGGKLFLKIDGDQYSYDFYSGKVRRVKNLGYTNYLSAVGDFDNLILSEQGDLIRIDLQKGKRSLSTMVGSLNE